MTDLAIDPLPFALAAVLAAPGLVFLILGFWVLRRRRR